MEGNCNCIILVILIGVQLFIGALLIGIGIGEMLINKNDGI